MYQAKIISQQQSGEIAHVLLNKYEFDCIQIALLGFTESIESKILPTAFTGESVDYLKSQRRYLQSWFENNRYNSYCSFTSSELINWLRRICQSCITEKAIRLAAADVICCDYQEIEKICANHQGNALPIDEILTENFNLRCDDYRSMVATYKNALVKKLLY